MALPEGLADALGELDAAHDERFAPWRNQWQAIRAHLLNQDAKLAQLEQDNINSQFDYVSLRRRTDLAESRLAAADALLRESRRMAAHFFPTVTTHDLYERIEAHLQGAVDEA